MAMMRGRWPERGLTVAAAAGPDRKGLRVRRTAASAAPRPPAAGVAAALPGNGRPRRCLMGTAGDPCSLPTRVTLSRDIPARPQQCHARVTPSRDIPERPQPCHPRISPAMTSPHIPSRAITVSPPAVPPTTPAVPGVPRSGAVTPFPGSRRAAGLSPGRGLEAPGAPERSAPLTSAGAAVPTSGAVVPEGFHCSRVPSGTPRVPPARSVPPGLGVRTPGGERSGSGGGGHVPNTAGTRDPGAGPGGSRRGRGTPGAPGLIAVPSAGALSPCAAEEPPRRAGDWSAKNAALISELIFTPSLRPICRDLPAMRSAGPGRGSAAVPAAPRYGRRGGRGARGYPGGRKAVLGVTGLSGGHRDAGHRGAVIALSPLLFEPGPRPTRFK